jgi:hypothetical protein
MPSLTVVISKLLRVPPTAQILLRAQLVYALSDPNQVFTTAVACSKYATLTPKALRKFLGSLA